MELHQLEIYATVIKEGSFSGAAEKLRLSQPTVSAAVAALERELGVQLIRRTTRSLSITESGKRLSTYAESMLNLRKRALRDLSGDNRRRILIGASSVPAQRLLPSILSDFSSVHPEQRLEIQCLDSVEVIRRVSDSTLDLGVVVVKTEAPCKFVPIAEDELVLAVPNCEPYVSLCRCGAGTTELLQCPFLLRAEGSGTLLTVEKILQERNATTRSLRVGAVFTDSEVLLQCLVEGMGVSILSKHTVEDYRRQGRIMVFPLKSEAAHRQLYLVTPNTDIQPRIVQDLQAQIIAGAGRL